MGVALPGGRHALPPWNNFFYPTRTYAFRGGRAWRPPGNATPTFRVPNKSWDQGLSAEVLFVSVVPMVLSQYWKRLEKKFQKRLFPRFPKIDENYKNLFSPAFFNMLKEPLLVQKQTIHQQKALDLSFNLTPWKWAWHYQEGATPPRREKHILLIFYGRVEVFWLFGFNDISRKPFLSYSHF